MDHKSVTKAADILHIKPYISLLQATREFFENKKLWPFNRKSTENQPILTNFRLQARS